ncbi:MAG TPA: hypothetical protein VFO86_10825, partial [Terriglobia bacterium]|nr:hypothetical protein [Terriglobia bacterium]
LAASSLLDLTGGGSGTFVFTRVLTFQFSDVDTATNRVTIQNHGLTGISGPFVFHGDGTPLGLTQNAYYVRAVDANTIQFLQSVKSASPEVLTNPGSGSFEIEPYSGVFRTTDGGLTWQTVPVKISGKNLEESPRIELTVSQTADPVTGNNPVYAGFILEDPTNSKPNDKFYTLQTVVRSSDLGQTWVEMSLPGAGESGIHIVGQGIDHFSFLADPRDSNIVYAGGDTQPRPFPSTTGANLPTGRLFRGDFLAAQAGGIGIGWSPLTDFYASGTAPHVDSRAMTIDALGSLIEVDDGGIYRLVNPLPFFDNTTVVLVTAAGGPALTFTDNGAAADTIERSTGSWLADGFKPNMRIRVSGSTDNNGVFTIASINAAGTVLTLSDPNIDNLTTEIPPAAPATQQPITVVGFNQPAAING